MDFITKWIDTVILFENKDNDVVNIVRSKNFTAGIKSLDPIFLKRIWKPDIFIGYRFVFKCMYLLNYRALNNLRNILYSVRKRCVHHKAGTNYKTNPTPVQPLWIHFVLNAVSIHDYEKNMQTMLF